MSNVSSDPEMWAMGQPDPNRVPWAVLVAAATPACSCGSPREHKLDDICPECPEIVAVHMVDDSFVFGAKLQRRPGCLVCGCREQHVGLTT